MVYADERDKCVTLTNKASSNLPTPAAWGTALVAIVQTLLLVADEVHKLRLALSRSGGGEE